MTIFFLYVEVFVTFSKLVELIKNAVYVWSLEAQYEILFYLTCVLVLLSYQFVLFKFDIGP